MSCASSLACTLGEGEKVCPCMRACGEAQNASTLPPLLALPWPSAGRRRWHGLFGRCPSCRGERKEDDTEVVQIWLDKSRYTGGSAAVRSHLSPSGAARSTGVRRCCASDVASGNPAGARGSPRMFPVQSLATSPTVQLRVRPCFNTFWNRRLLRPAAKGSHAASDRSAKTLSVRARHLQKHTNRCL